MRRGDEYLQLSTTLLQIENEFYGTIRPKQPIRPGERPLHALAERGVEYVEVAADGPRPVQRRSASPPTRSASWTSSCCTACSTTARTDSPRADRDPFAQPPRGRRARAGPATRADPRRRRARPASRSGGANCSRSASRSRRRSTPPIAATRRRAAERLPAGAGAGGSQARRPRVNPSARMLASLATRRRRGILPEFRPGPVPAPPARAAGLPLPRRCRSERTNGWQSNRSPRNGRSKRPTPCPSSPYRQQYLAQPLLL